MFSNIDDIIGFMVNNSFHQVNIFFDGVTGNLKVTCRKHAINNTFFKIICYEECDGLILYMKKMISLWANYLNYNRFNRIDNINNSYGKVVSLTCSKEKTGYYNFQLRM